MFIKWNSSSTPSKLSGKVSQSEIVEKFVINAMEKDDELEYHVSNLVGTLYD